MMIYSDKIKSISLLAKDYGCRYYTDEPLSAHTTFRVGGKCDIMVCPNSAESLAKLAKLAGELELKYFILGNGSNVLFSDSGYRGVIISVGEDMSQVSVSGGTVTACAGALLSKACRAALDAGLSGMEFAWGIPGTVGGAVYMNAGAYGGEMKDIVSSVTCVDEDGNLKTYGGGSLKFDYRRSRFTGSNEMIVSASFELTTGDPDEIRSKMDELMARRKSRQPLEYPSAGSTFKRPEGSYAGLVIENSGLKGCTVGGAQVSEKHANFIINRGGATASDILELIKKVRREVKEKTGYSLECEIKIVDE